MTTWGYVLVCDELEMIKALDKHHGQIDFHPSKHFPLGLTHFEPQSLLAFSSFNPQKFNLCYKLKH